MGHKKKQGKKKETIEFPSNLDVGELLESLISGLFTLLLSRTALSRCKIPLRKDPRLRRGNVSKALVSINAMGLSTNKAHQLLEQRCNIRLINFEELISSLGDAFRFRIEKVDGQKLLHVLYVPHASDLLQLLEGHRREALKAFHDDLDPTSGAPIPIEKRAAIAIAINALTIFVLCYYRQKDCPKHQRLAGMQDQVFLEGLYHEIAYFSRWLPPSEWNQTSQELVAFLILRWEPTLTVGLGLKETSEQEREAPTFGASSRRQRDQINPERLAAYIGMKGYSRPIQFPNPEENPDKYVLVVFSTERADKIVAVLDTDLVDRALSIYYGTRSEIEVAIQQSKSARRRAAQNGNHVCRSVIDHNGDWAERVNRMVQELRAKAAQETADLPPLP